MLTSEELLVYRANEHYSNPEKRVNLHKYSGHFYREMLRLAYDMRQDEGIPIPEDMDEFHDFMDHITTTIRCCDLYPDGYGILPYDLWQAEIEKLAVDGKTPGQVIQEMMRIPVSLKKNPPHPLVGKVGVEGELE